jgi:glutaredoxin
MKIVKYEKDNCPGCVQVKEYCEAMGYEFDMTINALTELTSEKRRELKLLSVPTIILFDNSGNELDRVNGINADRIDELFVKRGA